MSAKTLQAIHEAIAAHIEEERDDSPEYLTEWLFVASTVLADNPKRTGYWYGDSELPVHHAIGLLQHGTETVSESWVEDADD